MKQLFSIIFVLISCSNCFSQQQDSIFNILPVKDGKIFFDNVISQEGTTADLWLKANQFFVDNFRDAKNVIELNDKDNGIIMAKGNVPIDLARATFIMKVQCRDNRYRVQLYDIVIEVDKPMNMGVAKIPLEKYEYIYKKEKRTKDFYDKVPGELLSRLINTMSNSNNSSNEEW